VLECRKRQLLTLNRPFPPSRFWRELGPSPTTLTCARDHQLAGRASQHQVNIGPKPHPSGLVGGRKKVIENVGESIMFSTFLPRSDTWPGWRRGNCTVQSSGPLSWRR